MDPVPDEKMYSAKPAMIVVFALAVIGALGGWFYSAGLQRRPIQFWGSDRAALILQAPIVESLTLTPAGTAAEEGKFESLQIGEQSWVVTNVKDISRFKGLKNVRSALINDYSFDWNAKVDVAVTQWTHGLRFRDESRQITTIFDPERAAAFSPQTSQTHSIAPAMVGIARFLKDANREQAR
ncbi:MAG: hypothetical protein JNM18_23400 [Planctomycetaceae bacterium]|nr:hypothetical protein [Planctomycetaceae bacterium]